MKKYTKADLKNMALDIIDLGVEDLSAACEETAQLMGLTRDQAEDLYEMVQAFA